MPLHRMQLPRKRTSALRGAVTGVAVLAACALTAPAAAADSSPSAAPGTAGVRAGVHATPPAPRLPGRTAATPAARAFDASPAGRALQSAVDAAQSAAIAGHRTVSVSTATTPTSVLTAEPNGTFRQVTTLQPERFYRSGRWVAINTSLHRTPAGWAPGSAPTQVILSAGGTGPAATLAIPSGARTALTVPYALDAPVIAGSTATYRTSRPGVTLTLTVTPEGGVAETLTAPASVITPAIRAAVTAGSPATAKDSPPGAWAAATRADSAAFRRTVPVIIPVATRPGGTTGRGHARTADVAGADVAGAAAAGQARDAIVAAVTPAAMPGCSSTPGALCDNNGHYASAYEGDPTHGYYDNFSGLSGDGYGFTYGLPIGNPGVYGIGCSSSTCRARAYFEIPLAKMTSSMQVSSAKLYETITWSSDFGGTGSQTCPDTWPVQLWWTAGIGSGTDWNSPPGKEQSGPSGTIPNVPVGPNPGGQCKSLPPASFYFDVTSLMRSATANSWAAWTFGLYGDEAASNDPSGISGACYGGVTVINGDINVVDPETYNCGYSQVSTNPEVITDYDVIPPDATSPAVTNPTAIDNPGPGGNDAGCGSNTSYVSSTTPTLSAKVSSGLAGESVAAVYLMSGYDGSTPAGANGEYPSGGTSSPASPTVKPAGLKNGGEYYWQANSETDGMTWGQNGSNPGKLLSNGGPVCNLVVDTTAPPAPTVNSVQYNTDSSKHVTSVTLNVTAEEADTTSCGFSPCFDSGVYQFNYSGTSAFPACTTSNTNSTTSTAGGCETAIGLDSVGPYSAGAYSQGYPGTSAPNGAPIVNGTGLLGTECLDDYGNGTTAGTPVDIYVCNTHTSQNWAFQTSPNGGTLSINGLCMQANGNAISAGTLIVLATCSSANSPGEQWNWGTHGSLVNPNSGLCLYAPSTAWATQLKLATCDGSPAQDWSNTLARITIPVSTWGVNTIYLKDQTAAGATSADATTYSFYVPWSGTATLGDVTGDRRPDLLAVGTGTDSTAGTSGNLYAYLGQSNGTLASPVIVGTQAKSPVLNGGTQLPWNDFIITHRGSATGNITDDLYAYALPPNTQGLGGTLWQYADSDTSASTYNNDTVPPYEDTTKFSSVTDPGPDATLWKTSAPTQILGIGNPLGSTTDSKSGLLTIENGNLWYYQSQGAGSILGGVELGTGWGNMTLIAPGFAGPDGQQELWAADNNTGNLYAYHFTTLNSTLSLSPTAATITPEDGTNDKQINLPSNVHLTPAYYKSIASTGNGNNDGYNNNPGLYLLNAAGTTISYIPFTTSFASGAGDASDLQNVQPTTVGTAPAGVTLTQIS